jgi:hypothetical protein
MTEIFAGIINAHLSPSLSLLRCKVFLLVFVSDLWWLNQEWLELRWGRKIDQKIAAVHGMDVNIL